MHRATRPIGLTALVGLAASILAGGLGVSPAQAAVTCDGKVPTIVVTLPPGLLELNERPRSSRA